MQIVHHNLKRVVIAVVGAVVLILGIIMVPYPGPGWLTVFLGLGILSSEFTWAHRLRLYAEKRYHNWVLWLRQQAWPIQVAVLTFTAVITVTTIWLLNGFGVIDRQFGLQQSWLHTPLSFLNFLAD